ncbi:lysophospholipid acyltransferase [Thiopseudomonas alkaliphila]|uniref:lysophospholipid acyltransferase n=1 Tax=Thiopseudomonas alkaliphila TaxID=1697053 RepID=UPI00069E0D8B|nr:lysophospholipid acyltransferase [Thiopseudomonas alkaliphila]AKX51452.1 lipid A biosynthesis lauroyl acyltransferase [Thiopseudomonas alkaliphila]AKX57795.1 lipid A biosynthesis lauroyl acyltransferase [Thiopseudomonas alkaliphila]
MKAIKGFIATSLLRLIAKLPWNTVQSVGRLIGWGLWALPTKAKETVRINQSYCFPNLPFQERQALQKRTLSHIGKTMTESAAAWLWPVEKTLDLIIEVEGEEILQTALNSGLGVVGITSHLGNWEVLNHYFCSQCKPIIFYRPPKLKALDELISAQRVQLGNRVAPSTRDGILSVIKEVRAGGAVGIPADPEPSESAGFYVPFLGTTALTSKFVPSMLKGKKALGVFLHAIRLEHGRGFKVIIEAAPEAMYSRDSEQAVAAMSAVLARYVERWPEQYMWSMKRFKNRPNNEQRWY